MGGPLRDDVLNVRVSMSDAPVNVDSSDYRPTHFSSTHQDQFDQKPFCMTDISSLHKNMSSLPGFGDPPNSEDRFATTSGSTYLVPPTRSGKAAGVARHHAEFKIGHEAHGETLFGNPNAKRNAETSAQTMNQNTGSWQLKRKPRFVNGGDFRNASTVALDRNLAKHGLGAPQDYSTTVNATWSGGIGAQPPSHSFMLPQKNTSTYFLTSMAVATGASTPRSEATMARITPGVMRSRTAGGPCQTSYRQPPVSGDGHFATTHGQHFAEHFAQLVVPPGKGGVDRSMSDVPIGSDFDVTTTPQAHSHLAFSGQQLSALRETCASRGTLGARGGVKLPRGSSGAPAGFFHKPMHKSSDLRTTFR